MRTHYYCIISCQQILVHSKRNTILFEASDLSPEALTGLSWKDVTSYRNGAQTIHYCVANDSESLSKIISPLLDTTDDSIAHWHLLKDFSNLSKSDLLNLAYLCEVEIRNPKSEAFWIDLGRSLFTAQGQYWSPAHLNDCLKQRSRKTLIDTMPTKRLLILMLLSLLLGISFNGLVLGRANGVNSLVFIALGLVAIRYATNKRPKSAVSWILLSITLLIGAQYAVYNNPIVHALNAFALIPLLAFYTLSLKDDKSFKLSIPNYWRTISQICSEPFVNLTVLKPIMSRFTDNLKSNHTRNPHKEILLGLIISLPILLICGALLASSDPMFNRLIANNFDFLLDWYAQLISFRGIVILIMTLYSFGYLWQAATASLKADVTKKEAPSWSPIIGITFLICINMMYLLFTGIQVSYLYTRFAELPVGYTYAAYAREGFFQLFFVALINISISSILMAKIKTAAPKVLASFKSLNTLTCLLTINLLVSSFYKICLYEQAFGYTHLRLWVQCFSVALGACLILLVLAIWKGRENLFHRCTLILMVTYSLIGFVVTDTRIATWNLEHYASTKNLDVEYLSYLSVDAAKPIFLADGKDPNIKKLQRAFTVNHIQTDQKKYLWYEWNFNRFTYNHLSQPVF